MFSRVCVLAILLAASACARPDQKPTEINAWNPNSIKSSAAKDVDPTDVSTTEPVHRLFPSAVLFGRTCGGTIISDRWVLTAGHCTLFTAGRSVLAGTSRSNDNSGTMVRIKRLVLHPLFSVGPYWVNARTFNIKQVAARWDFMLGELEEPLPLDGVNIAAAALDEEPNLSVGLPAGYAGYGAKNHGDTMRHEMHAMSLGIQSDEVCSKLEQYNSQDMLCAKGLPPTYDSACNGDSGSGLIGDGRLLGVASWVEDDAHECANGKLVVFSRVSAARAWIRNVTGV